MEASNPTFGLMLKDGSMHVAEYTAPQDDILWSVDAYICQEVIFNEVLRSMSAGGSLTVEHDHEISTAARRMADGGTGPCSDHPRAFPRAGVEGGGERTKDAQEDHIFLAKGLVRVRALPDGTMMLII